jgi:hypothetical protein
MLYDAIINGARGVTFFGGRNPHCWNRLDRRYGWNWTFWNSALEPLIRQVGSHSALAPALADAASNHVLATNDRTTEAIGRTAVSPLGARSWAIAARRGPGDARVTITGLPASARSAAVFGEGRIVPITHGRLTDTFRQWQVHVYRITRRRRAEAVAWPDARGRGHGVCPGRGGSAAGRRCGARPGRDGQCAARA